MKKIRLIIEIHQPMRLEIYRFFEILSNHYYYNDYENEFYLKNISENAYLPANRILLDLIHYSKRDFKVSFLFSGVVLDQFELYAPEILESYKTLIDTGCVELLAGTYSNSFGPLRSKEEYINQLKLQKARIKSAFGKIPLSSPVEGFHNSNYRLTYPSIKILSGNEKLNDNISYRVNGQNPSDWLLRPEKLVKLLNTLSEEGNNTINLFLPYYLFGASQNKNSEILKFLESFPIKILSKSDFAFVLPSDTGEDFNSGLQIDYSPEITGRNFELFYESCNELQYNALEELHSLGEKISVCDDPEILKDWLYLQTCDHFHFMNPVLYHENESYGISLPYDSHYFAYINYMNILMDLSDRLEKWIGDYNKNQKSICDKIVKSDEDMQTLISLLRAKKIAGNLVNKVKNQI